MRIIRRLFFNLWYLRRPPWDTGVSPPELLDFIAANHPGRALDLGCGTGTNAITLARNGWQVTGVDFVPRAIRTARRKASGSGIDVDFQVRDVTQLNDLSGAFDLILDVGCYHSLHVDERQKYQSNIQRLLVKTGFVLLYAFIRSPDETQVGISNLDLDAFKDFLNILDRQDGTDSDDRPSAWFLLQNKS